MISAVRFHQTFFLHIPLLCILPQTPEKGLKKARKTLFGSSSKKQKVMFGCWFSRQSCGLSSVRSYLGNTLLPGQAGSAR